jgi:hypothetical protein
LIDLLEAVRRLKTEDPQFFSRLRRYLDRPFTRSLTKEFNRLIDKQNKEAGLDFRGLKASATARVAGLQRGSLRPRSGQKNVVYTFILMRRSATK